MNSGILTLQQAILRFGRSRRNSGAAADAHTAPCTASGVCPATHKVVFTNGCFDLLHPGHIRTLEAARNLGDALVVGLNSDRGVRELKGPDRPVLPEQERAEILAALACVDAVVIFDQPTPREIIAALLPDVLVKGGDWASDQIVGREEVESAGGCVVSIDLAPGYSTTAILDKIRSRTTTRAPAASSATSLGVPARAER